MHELASVTVQIQVPAVKPVTEVVPSPVGFPGVQLYVNPPAPPVGVVIEAAPFEPPKHETFVWDAGVKEIAVGCVIVAEAVAVQLFASVTVTVYVPAANPEALMPNPPEGDHE